MPGYIQPKRRIFHPQVVEFKCLAYRFSFQKLLKRLRKQLADSKDTNKDIEKSRASLEEAVNLLGIVFDLVEKSGDQLPEGEDFEDLMAVMDCIALKVYWLFKNQPTPGSRSWLVVTNPTQERRRIAIFGKCLPSRIQSTPYLNLRSRQKHDLGLLRAGVWRLMSFQTISVRENFRQPWRI